MCILRLNLFHALFTLNSLNLIFYIGILSCSLWGCVSVEIQEMDEDTEMQGGMMDQQCTIGDVLGICAVCGADGLDELPANDFSCPELDCDSLAQYRLVTNQTTRFKECRIQSYTEGPSRCLAIRTCHNDPQNYCIEQQERTIEMLEPDGCFEIQGCSGSTPPTISIRQGQSCQETGVCDERGFCEGGQVPSQPQGGMMMGGMMMGGMMMGGAMESNDLCDQNFYWQYNTSNQMCGGPNQNNECEFYITKDDNPWTSGEVSCNDFCTSRGGRCMDTFDNANEGCQRGDNKGCGETFSDVICVCQIP